MRRERDDSGCALTPSGPPSCDDVRLIYFEGSNPVIGGERGIRTLETLPFTHFPGVRLQPLGHLSGILVPACYRPDAKG